MFRNLLAVFTGDSTLVGAAKRFQEMVELARDMAVSASRLYWSEVAALDPKALAAEDARMNDLQQTIRRSIILHLSTSDATDVPYCLLVMSLVKDVERVGDYAKNLVSVPDLVGHAACKLPRDEVTSELRALSLEVERLAIAASDAYRDADVEAALTLTREGRARAKTCDALLRRVAAGDYDAATATRLTLTIRFYKRIQGHFLNLLSSLLMPLDRLDSYDESKSLRAS